MEEISFPQKLLAEVIGTAMLVFVGVGSVPATLIVGGSAPFTMAELGMISFACQGVLVRLRSATYGSEPSRSVSSFGEPSSRTSVVSMNRSELARGHRGVLAKTSTILCAP